MESRDSQGAYRREDQPEKWECAKKDVADSPGGHVHPRVYGSAARWLGPLVRERRVFSLEEAVHKASGKSAVRFGLSGRGVIREGAFADVIVFDPDTVGDRATYEQPRQDALGADYVAVNGRLVVGGDVKLDSDSGDLPGRYLRRNHG